MTEAYAILDCSPIGQLVIRKDFEVLFWNRCMETWTGIGRQEVVGTSLLHRYPHLEGPRYARRIVPIFKGGAPVVFSSQLHHYLIPAPLPGGRFRVQYTVVTRVADSDGDGYCAIFSLQDVTSLTDAIDSNRVAIQQVREEVKVREGTEKRLERTVGELQRALEEIKTLRGILPICASCKKIRDDKGQWNEIESYIGARSEAKFSHGICPNCVRRLYPDLEMEEEDW